MKLTIPNLEASLGRLSEAWNLVNAERNDLFSMGLNDERKLCAGTLIGIEHACDRIRAKIEVMESAEAKQKAKMQNFAEIFVGDLPTEALFGWCDIFKVPHNEDAWLDDDWPDKEDELRAELIEKAVT